MLLSKDWWMEAIFFCCCGGMKRFSVPELDLAAYVQWYIKATNGTTALPEMTIIIYITDPPEWGEVNCENVVHFLA